MPAPQEKENRTRLHSWCTIVHSRLGTQISYTSNIFPNCSSLFCLCLFFCSFHFFVVVNTHRKQWTSTFIVSTNSFAFIICIIRFNRIFIQQNTVDKYTERLCLLTELSEKLRLWLIYFLCFQRVYLNDALLYAYITNNEWMNEWAMDVNGADVKHHEDIADEINIC